jgi:pyridoxal 5'-phosphate synthase pdxS subunit
MDASNNNGNAAQNLWRVKVGLAEMLKGGVIMDVTNAEQAASPRRPALAP